MTYTSTHPTVQRAIRTYDATWCHTSPEAPLLPNALAAVLTEHKRKLQRRLRDAQALAAAEGREVVRLRVERDTWRAKAQAAEVGAATPQSPVTLREITDDDAAAIRADFWGFTTITRWDDATEPCREDWRRIARVLRDRLAASLPRWQPIAADDIKPGMLVRGTGCEYLIEGTVTEVSPSWITTSNESWITEGRTWEVDPRTVPAEPVPADPDAAAVEAMARAVCGDWDALPDSDRDEVRTEMRAALTAYRAHTDGEA